MQAAMDWHVQTYRAFKLAARTSPGSSVGIVGFVDDARGGYWQILIDGCEMNFRLGDESQQKFDYTTAAAALLAEVGLTFEDVYDLGRDWETAVFLPDDDTEERVSPRWRGVTHPSSRSPHSRSKPLIGLTGEIDCDRMLHILAHECGHVHHGFSSTPTYIQEYMAEIYANKAFERVTGRPVPAEIIEDGKAYVRAHCQSRHEQFGDDYYPSKGWDRKIIAWCEWEIPADLLRKIERDEEDRRAGR